MIGWCKSKSALRIVTAKFILVCSEGKLRLDRSANLRFSLFDRFQIISPFIQMVIDNFYGALCVPKHYVLNFEWSFRRDDVHIFNHVKRSF